MVEVYHLNFDSTTSILPNVDMAVPPKSSNSETVMVVIRMRPFNKKEKSEGRGPCVSEIEYIIFFPPLESYWLNEYISTPLGPTIML